MHKISCTILSLCLSFGLFACGTQNVAKDYMKNGGGKTYSGDASPAADQDSDPANDSASENAGEESANAETGDGESTGDASTGNTIAGNKLLEPCMSCHTTGGLAGKVVLNAKIIPGLDKALTGSNSAFHVPFQESFKAPLRTDLEAALKAIP